MCACFFALHARLCAGGPSTRGALRIYKKGFATLPQAALGRKPHPIQRGSKLKVSFVQPRAELRPYTTTFWVLESAVGMPQNDTNLAAPNGSPKLIILCENSLESIADGQIESSREGLYFVGNRDTATFVRSAPRKTTIIGIEFRPHGAFPVFGIPMQEAANRVLDWESVFGSRGGKVWETFRNLPNVSSKLAFIQAQLVRLLDRIAGIIASWIFASTAWN